MVDGNGGEAARKLHGCGAAEIYLHGGELFCQSEEDTVGSLC